MKAWSISLTALAASSMLALGCPGGPSGGPDAGQGGGGGGGGGWTWVDAGPGSDADRFAWAIVTLPDVLSCAQLELSLLGADGGAPSSDAGPQLAQLTLSDAGRLFASAACNALVTEVAVDPAAPTSVYLRADKPGPLRVTATHPSIQTGTLDVDVRSAAPGVVIWTFPTGANRDDCIPGMVSVKDSVGNLIYQRGQTLSLSASPTSMVTADAGFYLSGDCSGPAQGASASAPVPDSAPLPVSFRTGSTGTVSLTATSTPANVSATRQLQLNAPPYKIAFGLQSYSGLVGQCITNVALVKLDSMNTSARFDGGEVITLLPTTGVDYFRASPACVTLLTQVIADAGQSAIPLSMRVSGDAGSYTLSASEPGYGIAMATANMGKGPPARLAFVQTADAGTVGECLSGYLALQDSAGRPAAAASNSNLTLQSSAASFSTDPTCASSATSYPLTVPAFAEGAPFFFKGTTPGQATLSGSGAGLTAASKSVFFNSNPPAAIRFSSSSYGGTINNCLPGAVQLLDSAGGVALAAAAESILLFSDAGVLFADTSGCSGATTTRTITVNTTASSAPFYMTVSTAGTKSLEAYSATLGDAGSSLYATNPCASLNQACNALTPCCTSWGSCPGNTCQNGFCKCNIAGCIPSGCYNCGSSNNCCSGAIMGSTCY